MKVPSPTTWSLISSKSEDGHVREAALTFWDAIIQRSVQRGGGCHLYLTTIMHVLSSISSLLVSFSCFPDLFFFICSYFHWSISCVVSDTTSSSHGIKARHDSLHCITTPWSPVHSRALPSWVGRQQEVASTYQVQWQCLGPTVWINQWTWIAGVEANPTPVFHFDAETNRWKPNNRWKLLLPIWKGGSVC